jgi:predicted molibdopterin-dependent oxidoreductase YjgC
MSEPNVSKLELGLNKMEFLVMQDIFVNETMRFADVVFPAACFAEKDGVFTNSERRVQRVRKAVEPPGEARADWEILAALAKSAGHDWGYNDPSEIYAEYVGTTDKFSGISHERLDEDAWGLQWPCPTPEHAGTKFLHEGGILRGRGLMTPVEYRPSAEQADRDYPLVLSTGRTLYHYNAATQTRREKGAHGKQPESFVEISPKDAKMRGINHGDMVEISSRRGAISARAMISRQVRRGCIWMSLHFAEARANLLTNDAGDPVTATAEYKVCAAQVKKIESTTDAERFPGSFMHVDGPSTG